MRNSSHHLLISTLSTDRVARECVWNEESATRITHSNSWQSTTSGQFRPSLIFDLWYLGFAGPDNLTAALADALADQFVDFLTSTEKWIISTAGDLGVAASGDKVSPSHFDRLSLLVAVRDERTSIHILSNKLFSCAKRQKRQNTVFAGRNLQHSVRPSKGEALRVLRSCPCQGIFHVSLLKKHIGRCIKISKNLNTQIIRCMWFV